MELFIDTRLKIQHDLLFQQKNQNLGWWIRGKNDGMGILWITGEGYINRDGVGAICKL